MRKNIQHTVKETLLAQGVEKLKRFGFINVTKENITTDEVYSLYFIKILNNKLGTHAETDEEIKELLKSMSKKTKQKTG